MKIIEIRDTVVPIKSEIRNAYIDFGLMTVSVVALITDVIRDGKPVVGFGFNSNGRYAQQGLLRERFIPRLNDAPPESLINDAGDNLEPEKIWNTLMKNEKPGGHGDRSVAVGVLDMAVWDSVAKIAGLPLWRYLADRYRGGEAEEKVSVYAAGGYYYPGKDNEALKNEMKSYLDRGYTTVKMKIGGAPLADDLGRIEAVLSVVGEGKNLAVDANGKFDLKTAIAYAEALSPYNLKWYEEAGDPLDYALQAELGDHYEGPMATGENLFSTLDARNLIRHGGMRSDRDILQFDCALSYGLVEYLRTLKMLEEYGWPRRACIPHGGHQMCLNIAAGLGLGGNESYPDVFKPFNGFADDVAVENGFVGFPQIPGIGLEAKNEPYRIMKELAGL
ncbi:MAG: mandelate racemase/muconate lactonizing enzyme family protein [Nitrospinaceae bacterium]|nr:mandelate racemase/muconate lactonizing enzyme family protein [Nitrospinaceae bacterium]MBT3434376.1 mandelate racemase/muconate lactonizing enzyme family protein [Nitrospinaceae bacterium]MBT4429718.1 mandelate racemase/muconate lactonizing enzyme family protein [Nitrospinaceae bacterium]MBT5366956.1 mandelate racemase/muconate lactonizing enzyme family protein [Nitrospinaceae bacterium]MBT5947521.1 mandelate racemase/muconate lactonizing enzyme family protein [Nitrospinaceae bacterium]